MQKIMTSTLESPPSPLPKPTKEKPRRTSVAIAKVVEQCAADGVITVGELVVQMGHKALALAIFVFAVVAVIAGIIPGISTILAMPIIFLALQIVLGRQAAYIPKRFSQKEVSPRVVSNALEKSMPTLKRIERLMRPRIVFLTNGIFLRLIALLIIILAGIMAMPIPFGNLLPSFTITLLALAIIERDGVFLLLTLGTLFFTGRLMAELIEQAYALVMQWAGYLL